MEGFIQQSDVTSDGVLEVLRVWDEARGGLPVMPRSRLNPKALGKLLAWVFLVEFEFDPLRVRYRIVGSQQARLAGHDFTGLYLDQTHHSAEVQAFVMEAYRRVIDTRAPVFAGAGFPTIDGREHRYESCALPLGDDAGERVTHALAFEDLRFLEPGNALSEDPAYDGLAVERARTRPVRRVDIG